MTTSFLESLQNTRITIRFIVRLIYLPPVVCVWVVWIIFVSRMNDKDPLFEVIKRFSPLIPRKASGGYSKKGILQAEESGYLQEYNRWEKSPKIRRLKIWVWFIHIARSEIVKQSEKYDVCVEELGKAIRLRPKSARTHLSRGKAYRLKGNFDLAIQDFTKAIELKPQFVEAYFSKGNCLLEKGECAKAIPAFGEYIALLKKRKIINWNSKRKSLSDAYFGRGIAYLREKKFSQALENFNDALKAAPDSGCYLYRAWTYQELNDEAEALEDCDSAARLRSYNPFESSEKVVEKAIGRVENKINNTTCPEDTAYLKGLLARLRNYQAQARDHFEKALELGYADQAKVEEHLRNLR